MAMIKGVGYIGIDSKALSVITTVTQVARGPANSLSQTKEEIAPDLTTSRDIVGADTLLGCSHPYCLRI